MDERGRPYSDEAIADEDYEVAEAFTEQAAGDLEDDLSAAEYGLAESPTDPALFEAVVGETMDDEDVAVVVPGGREGRGASMRDGVDGTDYEAIFEEEARDVDALDLEYSERHGGNPPDLVELHDEHLEERATGFAQGELVTLRWLEPGDEVRLSEILHEPAVARWWSEDIGPEAVRAGMVEGADGTWLGIMYDGELVGSIAFNEENTPEYRSAGIDVFVTTDCHGTGVGVDALRTVARWLVDVRAHHRLTIDPNATNARAIAVYAKVGFRPVGIMRRYERRPDGTYEDGLLMDALADELTRPPE